MTRARASCAHFGVDFSYEPGTISISLHGELDALSVPAFDAVLGALAERGARSVALDLSDLRFCNVGGLRVMAELAARLNAIDRCVEIRAPEVLARMLEICDLGSLFVIVASESAEGASPLPARALVSPSDRHARSSRPRAGRRHRLATGP